MEINQLEDHGQEEKRPTFLQVLCILSFISIGFGFIGNFFGLLSGPLSADELEKVMAESMKMVSAFQDAGSPQISKTFEMAFRTQEYINRNFYMHTFVTLIGVVTGFIGVLFMYRGKRNGFHFYIIYNIISILTIYVSVPVSEVPTMMVVTSLILSALFILMYSRNLSWMKH